MAGANFGSPGCVHRTQGLPSDGDAVPAEDSGGWVCVPDPGSEVGALMKHSSVQFRTASSFAFGAPRPCAALLLTGGVSRWERGGGALTAEGRVSEREWCFVEPLRSCLPPLCRSAVLDTMGREGQAASLKGGEGETALAQGGCTLRYGYGWGVQREWADAARESVEQLTRCVVSIVAGGAEQPARRRCCCSGADVQTAAFAVRAGGVGSGPAGRGGGGALNGGHFH